PFGARDRQSEIRAKRQLLSPFHKKLVVVYVDRLRIRVVPLVANVSVVDLACANMGWNVERHLSCRCLFKMIVTAAGTCMACLRTPVQRVRQAEPERDSRKDLLPSIDAE